MKKPGVEEVLDFTFRYLERALQGEISDQDGFIRRTEVLADAAADRFAVEGSEEDAEDGP